MLKVMIVDDEPNIVQGLGVLIDWEKEGCEIVYTATNGRDALDYLRKNPVDLVLLDIQMPVMGGLQMLKAASEEGIVSPAFIILSGYNEFTFAQQALRLGCLDYLLKPVDRESLISVVHKISDRSKQARLVEEGVRQLEEAYLSRVLIALLHGRADSEMLSHIQENPSLQGELWFVSLEPAGEGEDENERRERLYRICSQCLPGEGGLGIRDFSQETQLYEIGLVLSSRVLERTGQEFTSWLEDLQKEISERFGEVRLLAGKKVSSLEALSQSYGSCAILKSMTTFREEKPVCLYEEELQVRGNTIALHKTLLDDIYEAVRSDDRQGISALVGELYRKLEKAGLNSDSFKLDINYLLFQLVHLASTYDDDVDQSYIAGRISDSSFEGPTRGGRLHLESFLLEYASYLSQLRHNVSGDVLVSVEKEIRENYAQNLTLRDLGSRYFLNSSYLGQIFRRKYGVSFKDYLNQVRIGAAAELLITTEEKITAIAEKVGYKDKDYFIRKFIEMKGCTPTKYRREHVN